MKKLITVILVSLVGILLLTGSVWGQKQVKTEPQAKVLALRAAYVDAYRNLAETVKGFQLDSKTTVRDFIVQNDVIRTELHTCLQGAYVTDRRFLGNGLVEVDIEIKKASLPLDIRRRVRGLPETIRATGAGAPPLVRRRPEPLGLPEWSKETIIAEGRGAAPRDTPTEQAQLLAIRAAKSDAYRNLAEEVWGLSLDAYTKVKDFVVDKDRIWTEVHAFIQGAKVIESKVFADNTAEVSIELDISPLCKIIQYGSYKDFEAKYPFDAQSKLLALRAAKVDAQRNLLETIQGVRIDSETLVKDFLTENDEIRTHVMGKLRGARVVAERILSEGIAEVDLELSVEALPSEIRHYLKAIGPVIEATGAGVHPDYWDQVAISVPRETVTQSSSEKTLGWRYTTIRVKGRGAPGEEGSLVQRKLMAERAAKVDAYRNLAERVYGFYLDSETTVELYVVQRDIIRTKVDAFIRGAKVISSQEFEDGSYEVELELKLVNLPQILGIEN